MSVNIAILVSGRGSNMLSIIKHSKEENLGGGRVVIVLSDVEDAPALEKARDLGIDAKYIPTRSGGAKLNELDERDFVAELKKNKIGLVCLAGFMRIIAHNLLEEYEGKILNIHPSLLPSFKGLDVQRKAIEYGVRFSGCTVHYVNEDVDGGPIILQECVPVLQDDTPETLSKRILKEEHKIYPRVVKLFCEGRLNIEGRRVIIS